jgi:DNA-binding response OmpR family regulator
VTRNGISDLVEIASYLFVDCSQCGSRASPVRRRLDAKLDPMNGEKPIRVLLVEDDFPLGTATVDLLSAAGYEVTLAMSAHDAYQSLATPDRFDVVLLDLILGQNRGTAVVAALRRIDTPLPPIIVLSALPMDQVTLAGQVAQAATVLQKPISLEQVRAAIDKAIGQQR